MLFSNQTEILAEKYGLERAVDMMIEAGYPAIDITMFELNACPFTKDYREVAERLCEKAEKHGVKFIQAHAPFARYEKYMKSCVPLFPRAFEFCKLLGIPNIVVHPIMPVSHYGNEEMLFDANMKFYEALVPLAKSNNVNIAIENMWDRHRITNRICDHVCADPKELARYYDTLKHHGCFTVCLDVGHVALCGREPEDAIRTLGDRIGCVHLHDVDYVDDLHTLPGAAKINWDNVCHALADIDYRGSFNMEADEFFRGFPEEHYPAVAKFMADTARVLSDKVDLYR